MTFHSSSGLWPAVGITASITLASRLGPRTAAPRPPVLRLSSIETTIIKIKGFHAGTAPLHRAGWLLAVSRKGLRKESRSAKVSVLLCALCPSFLAPCVKPQLANRSSSEQQLHSTLNVPRMRAEVSGQKSRAGKKIAGKLVRMIERLKPQPGMQINRLGQRSVLISTHLHSDSPGRPACSPRVANVPGAGKQTQPG